MKLSDDQIASIMTKNVVCKTILVEKNKAEEEILACQKEGWIFLSKSEINNKIKLTFKK